MNPVLEFQSQLTRRKLFGRGAAGLGTAALASLLAEDKSFAAEVAGTEERPGAKNGGPANRQAEATPRAGAKPYMLAGNPRAKRVIFLFQSGAPSQLDLFDYKPGLKKYDGQDLPDSVRQGQRLTGMTAGQTSFPIVPTLFKFAQRGKSGAWLSELLPHTAKQADELCFIKSMHTEAINHDPAITFSTTGAQIAGRPSHR